jgi:hypothetical protein
MSFLDEPTYTVEDADNKLDYLYALYRYTSNFPRKKKKKTRNNILDEMVYFEQLKTVLLTNQF